MTNCISITTLILSTLLKITIGEIQTHRMIKMVHHATATQGVNKNHTRQTIVASTWLNNTQSLHMTSME